MTPVRILVDSLADADLPNAQMGNAREIIRRLDPDKFHVSVFCSGVPDRFIVARPNTKIIQLPQRRQTLRILREFVFGSHEILFYTKASPASYVYMRMRHARKDDRIVIGTIESQSDIHREPTIKKRDIRLWEQTVLRCDYLFSNSAAVKQSLAKEYGLASELVPTGVDTNFFTPVERQVNSRLHVLFVGSLRPFKGPEFLLHAAGRFPHVDFVLAGEGVMLEELQTRVRREGLSNVRLAGGQTMEGLRELYRHADVFLFPSQWEGSPKVILEAAASGLPVIARNYYRPETVVNEVTGYLVASDDELYARLAKLLDDAELRERFGNAACIHSKRFDWNVITRRWEEIFVSDMTRQKRRHHE